MPNPSLPSLNPGTQPREANVKSLAGGGAVIRIQNTSNKKLTPRRREGPRAEDRLTDGGG